MTFRTKLTVVSIALVALQDIMIELAKLNGRMHTATLDQVTGTSKVFHLIEQIAEKAQQIVDRPTHQHERSQHGLEDIHPLKTRSSRNAMKLQETQERTQDLVVSVKKLRHLVQRFTV